MRILPLFFFLLFSSAQAQLTNHQTERINELLNGFHGRNAGISANVVMGDSTVYALNIGFADLENNIVVSDSTLFNLASCSKQYTGMAAWKLIGQNKIERSDRITEHLKLPNVYQTVRISHLLTHTHGIREFHTIRQLLGKNAHKSFRDREIWTYLNETEELSFVPGSKHMYSNSGFYLLHKIVSKTDAAIYDQLKSNAGLQETQWQNKRAKGKAVGYNYDKRFRRTGRNEMVFGYSNLLMSPRDLRLWMRYVLRSGFLNEVEDGITLADGQKLYYFGGLFRKKYDGRYVFDHGGIIDGFRSYTRYLPEINAAIGIVMNTDAVDPEYYVDRITDILLGKPAPRFKTMVGTVRDENGRPVPFAELYLDSAKGPVISDANGAFFLRSSEFSDYLCVKSPGFSLMTINLEAKNSPLDIVLRQEDSDTSRYTSNMVAQKHPDLYAISPWVSLPGAVMARKLRFPENNGTPWYVKFYITGKGKPDKPFRVHIYELDSSGFPGSDLSLQSILVHAEKGEEWVRVDLSETYPNLIAGKEYYFGLEWLVAPGLNGMLSHFIGFYPNSTGSSVYRVPTGTWRRCGELMYGGNQELAIEIENDDGFESNGPTEGQVQSYLMDTSYGSIMPVTFQGPLMFVQLYPGTREIRFDEINNNYWTQGVEETWTFYSKFDNSGTLGLVERRDQFPNHNYTLLKSTGEDPIQFRGKRKINNSNFKWRIRQKKVNGKYELHVYLKPMRKLIFKHYSNNVYYLEGDLGFNRFLWLTEDKGAIRIEYTDSRTLGIYLQEK